MHREWNASFIRRRHRISIWFAPSFSSSSSSNFLAVAPQCFLCRSRCNDAPDFRFGTTHQEEEEILFYVITLVRASKKKKKSFFLLPIPYWGWWNNNNNNSYKQIWEYQPATKSNQVISMSILTNTIIIPTNNQEMNISTNNNQYNTNTKP